MRILYLPSSLCQQRQLEKPNFKAYPVLMAMEAEWYRKQGHEVYWAIQDRSYNFVFDYGDHMVLPYDKIITEPEGLPFLSLPHPDRVFTRWWEYQKNGNFKYHPGTYIQAANGCWWGKCSFCVENQVRRKASEDMTTETGGLGQEPPALVNYLVRPVEDVIDEIKECQKLGFREVFDDSGTFPIGKYLDTFCNRLANRIVFGCNMRMVDLDYKKLKKVGFRMLLFGLESANQETLDKINKGVKVEDVKYIIKAARAGLDCHLAVMFGYPWESDEDALKTLRLVHWLLKKGYAKTAQASFYRPNNFGDRQETSNLHHKNFTKRIYDVAYSPEFWFNKIKDIHNIDDLKYLWRMIKAGLGR